MRARFFVATLFGVLLGLCGSFACSAPAADAVSTTYVHPGFAGAVIIHPRRILESPFLKSVPADVLSKKLEEIHTQSKIDPKNIERVVFLIGPAAADGDQDMPMTFGLIVSFHDPVDQKQLIETIAPKAETVEFKGKKYFRGSKHPPEAIYFADDKTMVFGTEKSLQKMLSAGAGSGPLADLIGHVDAGHDIVAVGVMAPVKEMATAVAKGAQLPDKLRALAALPEHLKSAILTADIGGEYLLKLAMTGNDEDGANSLQSYAIVGRDFIKTLLAAARPNIQQSLPPDAAGPLTKTIDDLIAGLKIKQDGTEVVVSLKAPEGWQDLPKKLAPIIEQQKRRQQERNGDDPLRGGL